MNCWLPRRPAGSDTFTKIVSVICLHCLVCLTCWLPVSLFNNLRLGTVIIFIFPPPIQYLTHRWSIKVGGRKAVREGRRKREQWEGGRPGRHLLPHLVCAFRRRSAFLGNTHPPWLWGRPFPSVTFFSCSFSPFPVFLV